MPIIMLALLMVLSGCVPSIRTSLVDVRAPLDPSGAEQAYKVITLSLLGNGFDLKMKDAGLRMVTTEYKKYTSVSGFPPFDFYLQIKAMVRDVPGNRGGELAVWAQVKEQNRLNQNAFTEHPLLLYSREDLKSTGARLTAMQEGHVLFRAIIKAVADGLGVPVDSFKPTTKQIEIMGM